MPSGRTHDRLAWWSSGAILLGGGALGYWNLALWAAAGSLFGGLAYSGDLDTVSRPLKRWGPLRWLWRPYRALVPHRGTHSHGLFWGPLFRTAYLLVVVTVIAVMVHVVLHQTGADETAAWLRLRTGAMAGTVAGLPRNSILAALAGIFVGNAVHSLADWSNSGAKRLFRPSRKTRRTKRG